MSRIARVVAAGVPHHITQRGKVPIVIEPVRARITLHRQGKATVYLLDHDGRRTDRRLPVQGGSFAIDGARDKTMCDDMVYE